MLCPFPYFDTTGMSMFGENKKIRKKKKISIHVCYLFRIVSVHFCLNIHIVFMFNIMHINKITMINVLNVVYCCSCDINKSFDNKDTSGLYEI